VRGHRQPRTPRRKPQSRSRSLARHPAQELLVGPSLLTLYSLLLLQSLKIVFQTYRLYFHTLSRRGEREHAVLFYPVCWHFVCYIKASRRQSLVSRDCGALVCCRLPRLCFSGACADNICGAHEEAVAGGGEYENAFGEPPNFPAR